MTLENIFYTMGIIYMATTFFFLIALIMLVFYIKGRISALQKSIEEKMEMASTVGQAGEKAFEKIKDFVDKKRKN